MDKYKQFRDKIKKVKNSRKHSITNSLGVYDAYKWIRKNKWDKIGRPLKEGEFYTIIRALNKEIANSIIEGNEVILPKRMGSLELRKYKTDVKIKNNTVYTNRAIDWSKTFRLWYEDPDSFNNRKLVRRDNKETYIIYYNKYRANYNNVSFYNFSINRNIKLQLAKKSQEAKINALYLNK